MSWNVGSVMTTEVVTVSPQATYKDIARRMADRRVSALPVVDDDGRGRLAQGRKVPHRTGRPPVGRCPLRA